MSHSKTRWPTRGTDKRFWQNHKPGDKDRYNSMETIHLDNIDDSGYPLDKIPCSNVTIKGCTFENVYAGLGTHHPATGTNSKNFTIQDCTFKDITANCINSYSFQNVTISKNTADNCRDFIYAQASEGVADNNKVSDAKRTAFNINNQSIIH